MKNLILVMLTLLTTVSARSQYGADGAVAGAAHGILWSVHKGYLEDIEKGQDKLIIANVAMALEDAKLTSISKKKYNSVSKIDSEMASAEQLTTLLLHGEATYDALTEIEKAIEGHDLVRASVQPALTDLYFEIGGLLTANTKDIATKEGQTNLMNSAERFLYVRRLIQEIDLINEEAIEILGIAQLLIQIYDIKDIPDAPLPSYNIVPAIEASKESIINLFKE